MPSAPQTDFTTAHSEQVPPQVRVDKSTWLERFGRKRNSDSRLAGQAGEPLAFSETAQPLSRHESTMRRRRDGIAPDKALPVQFVSQQHRKAAAATLSVNSLTSRNNSIFSAFGKLAK